MNLVKYWPIFKMVAIVNLYRQMLTGVRLQAHSMKLAETMIKITYKPSFNFMRKISNLEVPIRCVIA